MRRAAILLALLLVTPTIVAGPTPTVTVMSGRDFARPQAGEDVTYRISTQIVAADGEAAVDLSLRYIQEGNSIAWPTTFSVIRSTTGDVVFTGAIENFEQVVIRSDFFEGEHDIELTVETADIVQRFHSILAISAARPDGQGTPGEARHRFDFNIQPAPDDDGDGLINSREAVYGSSASDFDSDDDGLTDCQEVRHTVVSECQDPTFANLDGGFGTNPTKADTDGDGYSDLEELNRRTDPTKADTDDDGRSDYDEIETDKTNPLVKDEDGDGLLEGDEFRLKSNPLVEDTDDDGLTDGEEGHGTLNGAYNNETTDPTKKDTDGDGLEDYDEIVVHGTNPNHKDTDGDGISDNDESGGPTSPLKADSDGDGLNDYDEIFTHRTNAVHNDTDGDGLNDFDEIEWGSDPNKVDTDGDGLTDGDEVHKWKTNPTRFDSDDDGLRDGHEVTIYGTDPADFDTDDDGLTDGEEDRVYKTDPLKFDTDGDGIGDGKETAIGTDPARADTDGDGWPDGIEFNYGGDPLDSNVGAPDADSDLITDLLDPDADGNGLLDQDEALAASQATHASLRAIHAPTRSDLSPDGTVSLRFEATGNDVHLWRLRDGNWSLAGQGTTPTDAEARDQDQYVATDAMSFGIKRLGANAPTDLDGFGTLAPWEFFMLNVFSEADDIVMRSPADTTVTLEVITDGESTEHRFDLVSREERRVAVDELASPTKERAIFWIHGDERIQVYGADGIKEKASLTWIFVSVGAVLLAGAGVAGGTLWWKRRI